MQLLRDAGLEVEIGTDWDRDELERRIGEFDGILIRSATQLDADLLERAERLKAVGRAGVGVDNVDVDAATKRGVIVANAPQSNVITAAEHTLALLLALARKVPQAHGSLTGGAWDRAEFSGVELYEKTLGRARLRPHRPARGAAGARFRHARGGVRRLRRGGALSRGRRGARRVLRGPLRAGRFRDRAPSRDARDRELARRRRLRRHEGRGARDQRGARQADGRGGAARGARLGEGGRRGARRVPRGARHRQRAVRLSERGGHAAPRRFDHRGHRPRRLSGGGAGGGCPHGWGRDERGECAGDRA